MRDIDIVAKILVDDLDAGSAHARIVAKKILDRLFGEGADNDDEPMAAEVVEGRCAMCGQAVPEYGGIVMDRDRHEIRYGGKRVGSLTGKEFAVFEILFEAKGRTVSKDHILSQLYQLTHSTDEEAEIKIVDVFVCKTRKKVAPLGLTISTAWGRGYYLEEPGKETAA